MTPGQKVNSVSCLIMKTDGQRCRLSIFVKFSGYTVTLFFVFSFSTHLSYSVTPLYFIPLTYLLTMHFWRYRAWKLSCLTLMSDSMFSAILTSLSSAACSFSVVYSSFLLLIPQYSLSPSVRKCVWVSERERERERACFCWQTSGS